MNPTRRYALLLIGFAVWFGGVQIVAAQDDAPPLATPIVDTGEGDPATLSLTLDTESTIQFPDVEPGSERELPDAVSLVIAPGGGEWLVACSVALGANHSTSAGVDSLRLRLADAPDWQTPGMDPIPCASGGNDGATLQFDLSVVIPEGATPGIFELTVTFAVSAS